MPARHRQRIPPAGYDIPYDHRTGDGAAPSASAATATAVAEAPAESGGTATAVAEAPVSTEKAPALQPTVSPAIIKMITPQLKTFLENRMASGDEVTIELKKNTFTGRIYRLMLDEGWIAMESFDGQRRALYVITGGKMTSPSGEEVTLPA